MKDSCLKTTHLRLILSAFIWCRQRNSGVTSKQRDEQIHPVLIRVFLHIVPSLTATLFVNVKYHFQCCCFYFFLFNIMFPYREGRYLLIMTENFAALSRIKQLLLELDKEEPYVIFGSSFPKDQLFTQARVNFILLRKVPFLREWSVSHVVFPHSSTDFLYFSTGLLSPSVLKKRWILYVTFHRILMLKVKALARHAFTLKQKNLF